MGNEEGRTFYIIEDGHEATYRRTGACNMCGACCCTNEITWQVATTTGNGNEKGISDDTELGKWEGFSVFYSQGLWWWVKPTVKGENRLEPCSAYVDGRCNIWQTEEWPAICRYWPVCPNDVAHFPQCGFRFERIKDE